MEPLAHFGTVAKIAEVADFLVHSENGTSKSIEVLLLADFDGALYSQEYLSLARGCHLISLHSWDGNPRWSQGILVKDAISDLIEQGVLFRQAVQR